MPDQIAPILGLVVILAAIVAIARGSDVRLVLLVAAFALGALSGHAARIAYKFFDTLTDQQFVIPICTAMGFARVLRLSECDRHLVTLLTRPLRRVRLLLIPGTVLIGFIVNASIISQASTAVAVGTVVVPLLRSARFSAVTIGAALTLGASIGGEVLNPGAPEIITISKRCGVPAAEVMERVAPMMLLQLGVALCVFWPLCLWIESRKTAELNDSKVETQAPVLRVNPIKALVPIIPLALLMVLGPPLNLVEVPHSWLVDPKSTHAGSTIFGARLVGASMLLGTVLASLMKPSAFGKVAGEFFDGAGWAMARIIAVIVAASCFAEGIRALELHKPITDAITNRGELVWLLAGLVTLVFSALSGSGYAATQSLYGIFVHDAMGIERMMQVGAVVSVAAAAGRTMSPVAAVNLTSASLTDTAPVAIARRVAVPLLIATAVTVAVSWLRNG